MSTLRDTLRPGGESTGNDAQLDESSRRELTPSPRLFVLSWNPDLESGSRLESSTLRGIDPKVSSSSLAASFSLGVESSFPFVPFHPQCKVCQSRQTGSGTSFSPSLLPSSPATVSSTSFSPSVELDSLRVKSSDASTDLSPPSPLRFPPSSPQQSNTATVSSSPVPTSSESRSFTSSSRKDQDSVSNISLLFGKMDRLLFVLFFSLLLLNLSCRR